MSNNYVPPLNPNDLTFNEVFNSLVINKLKDNKDQPFFTVTCPEGYVSGVFTYYSQAKKALKRIASNIVHKHNNNKVIRVK